LTIVSASAVLLLVGGAFILPFGKGNSSETTAKDRANLGGHSLRVHRVRAMSAYEAAWIARITAVIADAHSGRYFTNDFEHTYSAGMESSIVMGMDTYPVGKKPTDEMLACMLSYVESTTRGNDAFPMDGDKVGVKATANCSRLGVK
jgi:hypothetical protein